jgi:exopolyphosphatase/guanosine-5'-triphosphate,3'-diphosphate pyrophosphatase
MLAALAELDVPRINPVGGALRLGVLHDLLGRTAQRDVRVATVERFIERYHIDRPHAQRVSMMARKLYETAVEKADPQAAQRLAWAGLLHEVGYTVSHTGFHRHGAYILDNADMPGFSAQEQHRLALLVLGCRGRLAKMAAVLDDAQFRTELLALRLAVLFHHARRPIGEPKARLRTSKSIRFSISRRWLAAHPLTQHLLDKEREEWRALGYAWKGMKA